MIKLIKVLLWTVASLVVVIILASILIPILVDPNDYKEEIAQQVRTQTGRTLTIDGDIDLSISLPLSVSLELGQTRLSNAEGFNDKPFAQMQGASVYVSIMPLLTSNQLDVGEIKLSGMELNLIKNKQGETNWADLSGSKEGEKAASSSPSDDSPKNKTNKSDKASTPSINIAGLSISDAVINWTDEQAKQKISLTKSNITISELIEDKPFNFQISTHIKVDDLAQSKQAAIEGDFSLETKPTISLSKQLFQLPGTLLSLDLKGDMLPGGSNKTTLSGDINFDGNTQLLDINKMSLTSDGLTADVAPENKAPVKLTGNIHFNGQTQVLDIKDMKLSALDLVVNGLFHAKKLSETPEFNGTVNIEKFSPKQLGAILGAELPAMKEAKALDSADVKMTFKGNTETMTISSLEANLDETSLKGTASIKNFKAPHYGFDLTLNQLNLDYYAMAETPASKEVPVAETTPKKKETKKGRPSPKTNAPLFPVEMLRQLNLNGKLAIGQFIAGGAKMSNVVIILKGKDGLVQLKPLKAQLYKGSINLNTDIDVRGKTPKLKIINKLNKVQIGDLLQDTTGSQEFTGQANINANITTSGNDNDRLVKNSNGKINLLITDGHVKKLDILDTLRKADALLKGRPTPTSSQEKNTKFTELKGTFKVKNGVVHNNDLASQSPVMSLTGKGYADFPKEYLDYTLKVKLLNSVKIDDKTQGTDYKGKEIPYTIKGKFSELSEEANISKVLEQEVKKSIEKKLNKKFEEKFGDKFKGMLKF